MLADVRVMQAVRIKLVMRLNECMVTCNVGFGRRKGLSLLR